MLILPATLALLSAKGGSDDSVRNFALALKAFYSPCEQASCVEVKLVSVYLEGHAPGVSDSPAGRRIAERHAAVCM